jgi:selenocysteine lyase/cysteine desulfurase
MIGAMASVQLPLGFPTDPDIVNQLRVSLYEEYMIEVPILPWQNGVLVRISAQMYLTIEDLDRLIIALEDSKARFKNK